MKMSCKIQFAPGDIFDATVDGEYIGEKEVIACFPNPNTTGDEIFVVFCNAGDSDKIVIDVQAGLFRNHQEGVLFPVQKPEELEYIQNMLEKL